MEIYHLEFKYRNPAFSMKIREWCMDANIPWRWVRCSQPLNIIEVFSLEDACLLRTSWIEDEDVKVYKSE